MGKEMEHERGTGGIQRLTGLILCYYIGEVILIIICAHYGNLA